jgi:hypothetical protein
LRFASRSRKLGGVQSSSAGDDGASEAPEASELESELPDEGAWRYARQGCAGATLLAILTLIVLWALGRHAPQAAQVAHTGSSVCERARRCCIETVEKRVGLKGAAGAAKAARACDAYAQPGLPDENCAPGLVTFQKSAASLGLQCP